MSRTASIVPVRIDDVEGEPATSTLRSPKTAGDRVKVASHLVADFEDSNNFNTYSEMHLTERQQNGNLEDPTTPSQQESIRNIMTSSFPPKNKWRIIGACSWSIASGFSDAAPGALLPTIEAHYSLSYSLVSLIWMSNAIGFITVALFSHKIQPWLGREKSIPFGCICSIVMYTLVAIGGPFPLVVTGFFFGGVGLAMVLAQVNVFVSKLEKNSKYLSYVHGCYGLGATISPFLATTMIEHNVRWNYVYLILLGLMLFNLLTIGYAFQGSDDDLSQWDDDDQTDSIYLGNIRGICSNSQTNEEAGCDEHLSRPQAELRRYLFSDVSTKAPSALKMALKNVVTWEISLFTLFYQGCEVALGGWIVTYLIDSRLTNTSYGYVSSGFWGGLTLGRLFLTRPLHRYLGIKRANNVLILATILMLILTWVVSSDVLSSVFVSIAGTLIGPIYPLMIAGVSTMLPRKIQVISLTIMTAFGSSGGALIPFFVGLVSQSSGTFVVLPICIAGYTIVFAFWLMLPSTKLKNERPQGTFKRLFQILW